MERRTSGDYQAIANIDGHRVLMHRFIMGVTDSRFVDHRDHNPLNNQRSNLRICTPAENCRNSRKRSAARASSRFKGVCWHKGRSRWRASIVVNYKNITIGQFADELEAARAYDRAAREHFGEFACLNFPEVSNA